MLRTRLCDLLGIELPVIQAAMGTAGSAELAAAVSNAGGLGSLGAFLWQPDAFRREIDRLRALTARPFALNHVVPALSEEAFAASLAARPRVLSFALADAGDLVQRAHDAGALVMQQVTTVRQAVAAAENGADIIVAQGGEAGGFGGVVATLPLVPQVVDAVAPLPVVAAGGIVDGRGIAAALMLGAVGVNIGTRFLASREAPVEPWKAAIAGAASEDTARLDFLNAAMPVPGAVGYGTEIRAIRTPFIDGWLGRPDDARAARDEIIATLQRDGPAVLPVAGQSAGAITDVLPAAEILQRLAATAEQALRGAAAHLGA